MTVNGDAGRRMARFRRQVWMRWIATLGGVLLAAWSLPGAPASAEAPKQAEEYEIKAGYLFNVAKFVEWPKDAFAGDQAPLIVAVLGKDPFGPALDAMQGRQVQKRTVLVKRGESLSAIATCHVLFVSESERGRLAEILPAVKGPVLTVSDIEGFSVLGGCITFVRQETKLGMEANPDAAQRAGLKISSKLLSIVKVVKDGAR